MALQLVKALGAVRVILTGTRPARLVLGKELGADVIVNSREQDPVAAVREATGGRGADVTLDCAGGDDTFDQAIKMTKPGGRVILVAFYHGPVTADMTDAVRRNLTIYTERGEGGTNVGRALALLSRGSHPGPAAGEPDLPAQRGAPGVRSRREADRRSHQGHLPPLRGDP